MPLTVAESGKDELAWSRRQSRAARFQHGFDHARRRRRHAAHAISMGGNAEVHAEQAPAERQQRQNHEQPQRARLAEQRPDMEQAAHDADAEQIVKCAPAAVRQREAEGARQPRHQQQHSGPAQPHRPALRPGRHSLPGAEGRLRPPVERQRQWMG